MDIGFKKSMLELIDLIEKGLKNRDNFVLDSISSKGIQDSTIFQNENLIALVLIAYALKKLIERQKTFGKDKLDALFDQIYSSLELLKSQIRKNDERGYKRTLKRVFGLIKRIDNKLVRYFDEILDKSKLKKGYGLFEYGISLGRISEMLGISQWELMNYIGKTNVVDQEPEKDILDSRIALTKRLFKLK